MPRFMDYMVSTPGHGRLEVLSSEPQRAEIFYIPSREAIEALTGASIPSRIKLMDIDRSKSQLTILPINTRWNVETFLKPKYAQIRQLTLSDRGDIGLERGNRLLFLGVKIGTKRATICGLV